MLLRCQFALLASVFALAACGGCNGDDESRPPPQQGASSPTAESARCIPADTNVTTPITNKLTVEGAHIDYGRAVKSEDFERMYFLSAELEGSGLDGRDDIATWATESIGGSEPIYAVDNVAKKYSDWRDGAKTKFKLSLSQDGARESRDCVAAAAGGSR
jgi:hypothetical protein